MKKLEFTRFKALTYSCEEAINTLCTNLTFIGDDMCVLMVTSAQASEGKSFVAMNLMRTFAKLGRSVVYVDADLRRSKIATKYGMKIIQGEDYGLTHYLAGMCSVDEIVYETNISGAHMIPLRREVSNSLSLLSNGRFARLIEMLKQRYDYVIIDAPPVGVIIDAAKIAKYSDGAIITVKYNCVSGRELASVKNQIERSNCPVLGVVLNSVELDSLSSKKYYHKSYYANYESDYLKSTTKEKKVRVAEKK